MPFKPGERIDRYSIEALLGEGGMGEVYRAHDARLHRNVALKILRVAADAPSSGSSSPAEGAARMLREARAAAALDHPNAVSIFDVGELEGTTFIAMELIEGKTLRAFIGDSTITLERRVRWLLDVARALAAAHKRGLVHRDIKPENVMVRDDGVVKVLDFGIARRAQPKVDEHARTEIPVSAATATGDAIVGTPLYMAPEQMRGDRVDGRTDQFAWGVLAYELLSGRLPFGTRDNPYVVVAELLSDKKPSRVSAHRAEVPALVDQAIGRALEKRPDDRFASMDDLIAFLEPAAVVETPSTIREDRKERDEPAVHAATMRSEIAATTPTRAPLENQPIDASPEAREAASYGTRRTGLAGKDQPRDAHEALDAKTTTKPEGSSRALATVLIGCVLIVALVISIRASHIEPPSAPSPATSASASVVAVPLTELPRPTSSSADALAAYMEGMQALRDAAWDVAIEAFERAVKLDPALAAAHLRLSLVNVWASSPTVARESFQKAYQLRSALPPHEQTLLQALEPFVQGQPSDPLETEMRLRAATDQSPGDVELLGWLALILGAQQKFDAELVIADRAVQLDPKYADGWDSRGNALARLGRFEEAEQSLDQCMTVSPAAADCLWHLITIREQQGACAQIEADARRWLARQPASASGYHELAKALYALGHPRETVEEALRQKWSNLPVAERKKSEAIDRIHLDILDGDFTAAAAKSKELLALIDGDPNEFAHVVPARTLVDLELETGRFADAGKVAGEFLRRKGAWVGSAFATIAMDATLHMEHAELRAGLISAHDFDARRTEFISAWRPKMEKGFGGLLWIYGFARTADTEAEARAALAALPAFGPLPLFRPRTLAGEDIGRVYYLADQNDEAIVELTRATQSCRALDDPLDHTRAYAFLGMAKEESGDKNGACVAYQAVLRRWGKAKPRSVTAEEVGEHAKGLGCGL